MSAIIPVSLGLFAPPRPPEPKPDTTVVGSCQSCGDPMTRADLPFRFLGPSKWYRHSWVCRCGDTFECPACRKLPAGLAVTACPKCGCEVEYT